MSDDKIGITGMWCCVTALGSSSLDFLHQFQESLAEEIVADAGTAAGVVAETGVAAAAEVRLAAAEVADEAGLAAETRVAGAGLADETGVAAAGAAETGLATGFAAGAAEMGPAGLAAGTLENRIFDLQNPFFKFHPLTKCFKKLLFFSAKNRFFSKTMRVDLKSFGG